MSDDPSAGQNPSYGAAISYYLKSAPAGDVRIRIEDSKGQVVRTLNGTKNVGLNRVTWNLEGEPTTEVRLRTSPAYAPEIKVGPDGTRNAPGTGRMSILMPPGRREDIGTVRVAIDRIGAWWPARFETAPDGGGEEAGAEATEG